MTTAMFDSEGVEYQSGSAQPKSTGGSLSEIREAFISGLRCRIGSYQSRLEALCHLRARIHQGGRAEHFYGYYFDDSDSGGFDAVAPAFEHRIEQQWGGQVDDSLDDGKLPHLLSTVQSQSPSQLPGSPAVHDEIRLAALDDLQVIVDVPDERTAVALLKSYYKPDGRSLAIGDEYNEQLYGGVNIVLLTDPTQTGISLRETDSEAH